MTQDREETSRVRACGFSVRSRACADTTGFLAVAGNSQKMVQEVATLMQAAKAG